MGKMSRNKGAGFERELANEFKAAGYEARRGMRQSQDAAGEPDVVLEGRPEVWIEAKRGKVCNPRAALRQMADTAPSTSLQVAITRDDDNAAIVTMSFVDWMVLFGAYADGKMRD